LTKIKVDIFAFYNQPAQCEGKVLDLDDMVVCTKVTDITRKSRWVPMAHTCNPSYLGGKDLEDRISKPALANNSQNPALKKD
jgi:hypothetical protein